MGPVGIADLPAWTYFTSSNAILLNCYESSSFTGTVSDAKIRVEVKSEYPLDGHIDILVRAQKPTAFALDLRIPDWCEAPELNIGGEPWKSEGIVRGIMRLQRKWQGETHLLLNLPMRTRVTKPMESVPGYCMIERGPLVLAMTRRFNPNGDGWCYAAPIETNGAPLKLERISLAGDTEEPVVGWQTRAQTRVDRDGKVTFEEITITLVPFYQAGTQRDPYVAAFPTASTLENLPPRLRHQTRSSLGAFGAGARAVADGEATDQDGCANYAIDGDLATVWRSGTNGYPHWIEIKLPERKTISRVIIRFGDRNNHPVDFKLLAGKTEGASDEILAIKGCTIADYYWAKFDPVEVDSVRLILQKSSDEDASSAPIREIELYRN